MAKPERINNQELYTMPMHEKQRGVHDKQWASASAKTTPISISSARTAERSIVSYDITQKKTQIYEIEP
jgi:hypothetical protein